MPQARRSSMSSSLLALNEGLDDILITLKDVNRESPATLRGKQDKYSRLRFEDIRKSFEEYMEHLPLPGTKLISKDLLVVHNSRQTLSGAFSLFESRVQRFIEDFSDVITVVEKGQRKRPAGKEAAKVRAAKDDAFTAISLIADAAAAAARSTVEPLQDFDLAIVFETQGNRNDVLVTIEEVEPHPALSPLEKEFQLDPIDDTDMDIDKIIVEVDERARRTPVERPPSISAFPEVPAEYIRAEGEEGIISVMPDAHIRPAEILPQTPHPDAMNVVILEETPGAQISPPVEAPGAQISPPLMGPRLVLEQATESREREPLEVAIRRRIEDLAAQEAAKTDGPKRTYRKKCSRPVGFLKKDLFRVNLQLTSARVNKIVKGSSADITKQKWMRRARPDPYNDEKLLKEAESCPYQFKYWKKYPKRMDDDVDEIGLVVQCLQEEFPESFGVGRTPLRAGLSSVYSAIEEQTPQRHAAASPSPRLSAVDSLKIREIQEVEGSGDQHTPLLPVPPPDRDRSEGEVGIRRRVVDLLKVPEIQEAKRSGDQHTPLLPVPPPTFRDRERSEEEAGVGSGVMEFLQPLEVQMEFLGQPVIDTPHTAFIPVPQPPIQPPEKEAVMERRVDETGVPIPDEAELSDATRAKNALERREELRIKVVGKLREAFANNSLAVLAFTDLCPLSSTKHQASQTFVILMELWCEGLVNLSQDSPKPQHIYVKAGKRYNSSTETCSSGSTSA